MKKPIGFRIEESLIADMQKVSNLENRSVNNLVETVMKDYCSNRLPPDGKAEKKKKAASGKLKSKK